MSWRDRPYSGESEYGAYAGGGGGGLRSWAGGLPKPGKAVGRLIAANVAMFVLCLVTGGYDSPIYNALSMNAVDAIYRGQIWRLFTFSYLHDQQSLFHILFNMIGLYFLGMPLERRWGAQKLFIFYTVGSLVAVALFTVLSLVSWLPFSRQLSLVGASGGVLALLGACAVLFPHIQLILVVFPVPIRVACLLFAALYTWNLIQGGANAGGDACHIAGLAFGIYFGYRGERWFRRLDDWRRGADRRAWEARQREAENRELQIDDILAKVRRDGIGSLTAREKRTLEEATRAQREGHRPHRHS